MQRYDEWADLKSLQQLSSSRHPTVALPPSLQYYRLAIFPSVALTRILTSSSTLK